jgi:hypothetical protein
MNNKADLTNSQEQQQSVELIYKYIEQSMQTTSNSIGRLETRITTLLGFSGLLLRFTIDLPQNLVVYGWELGSIFKIVICIILALAIAVCVFGLFPKSSGDLYTASELLDELDNHDQSYSMKYIALSRDKTLEKLDKLRLRKVTCLKLVAFLILISTLLFATDISFSAL